MLGEVEGFEGFVDSVDLLSEDSDEVLLKKETVYNGYLISFTDSVVIRTMVITPDDSSDSTS